MIVTPPVVATPYAVGSGGTGLTSYTIGDILYASGVTTLAKLADVAINQVLVSGGVGSAPAWSSTPILGGLTLNGTLAMGANAITFNGDATLVTDGANIIKQVNGTTAQEFRVYRNATTYLRMISGSNPTLDGNYGTALTLGGTLNVQTASGAEFTAQSGLNISGGRFRITAMLAGYPSLAISAYSLTGSSTISMIDATGTLNTSGTNFDVWKLAVTDTAHGAGVNIVGIYGGGAGATALMSLDTTGLLTAVAYKVGTTAGVSGTWTTVDGKTITSTLGLITSIV